MLNPTTGNGGRTEGSVDEHRSGLRVIVCLAFDRRAPPGEIAAFKAAAIGCPMVLSSAELTGTFDFMAEIAVVDLEEYNERLKAMAEPLARLVERYEASFICKRFERPAPSERTLWVPCPDGMQSIIASAVDKVTAEGDYMRIHSEGHSWLLHATMRSLAERLGEHDFVQIHRSTLVRTDFIDRMIHEDHHWTLRLRDGSYERIAKGHLVDVMHRIRGISAKPDGGSSNPAAFAETRH